MQRPLTTLVQRVDLPQFLRFGTTGVAGFAVDFGLLVVLRSGLGLPLGIATVVAYVVGGIVHYGLTRLWVFPHAAAGHSVASVWRGELGKVGRYLLLASVNIVLTLLVVLGLSSAGVDYRVAKLIAVAALFFSNYFITPRFVMPAASAQRSRQEA